MANELLGDFDFVRVYIDEVVINSNSIVKRILHITVVCEGMQWVGIKVKLQKCNFGEEKVEVLGHIVSSKDIKVVAAKVQHVLTHRGPWSKRELLSFLMFCSFSIHESVRDTPYGTTKSPAVTPHSLHCPHAHEEHIHVSVGSRGCCIGHQNVLMATVERIYIESSWRR